MGQTLPPQRKNLDAIGFSGGVDSFTSPQLLKKDQVRWADNAVCKGAIWQVRPGFKAWLSCCLTPGSPFYAWWVTSGQPAINPQFFTVFQPTNGIPYAVFAVSGSVFYAPFNESDDSIGEIQQILGLQFDLNVEQIYGVAAIRSADLVNGIKVNISPRKVLMLCDGVSRTGYWDGLIGAHLNPQNLWTTDPSGNTLYASGWNQTPVCSRMAWSGNRLWVFYKSQGYASDANDPFYFTEQTVLTQVPVFNFPDDVVGCVDRGVSGVTNSLLFVMTVNQVWTLWSGVQDRTQWINTPDFQATAFSAIGCVAGKSIINHMGLLYWYSDPGVVAFDSLGTVTSTQALPVIDSPMAYSKLMMGRNRSRICAGNRDSYVFWGVPVGPVAGNGRGYNGHMQVLDRIVAPVNMQIGQIIPYGVSSWQGAWRGIRPVEFCTATIYGKVRNLCFSMDYDGVPRIWETFQSNRSDNGSPIDWAIETQSHPVTDSPFTTAIFRHMRLLMEQVYGTLSITGSWKGLWGVYHQLLNRKITATPGAAFQSNGQGAPTPMTGQMVSFQKQVRDVISPDNRVPITCSSKGVEIPDEKAFTDSTDRAFSLLLQFNGVGALLAYRIATDAWAENVEGSVDPDETGVRVLPEAGCPFAIKGLNLNFLLPDGPPQDALLPYESKFVEVPYESPVAACQ